MGAARQSVYKALQGYMADTPNNGVAEVPNVLTKTFYVTITDGGTAATGVAETIVCAVPFDCTISNIAICPSTAVASNGSNFAQFNVFQRLAAAPATQNIVAAPNTSATSLVQWQSLNVPPSSSFVTPANLALTAGSLITVSMTKGGTGVATNGVVVAVTVQEII